jgi:mercuric ion binding protein
MIGLVSCKNQTNKESETAEQTEEVSEIAMAELSFGVRGNCGMCESTIEKAALSVEGVIEAAWDVDKKKIDVSYDDSKTDEMAIHNAIATSGYDTEKLMGNADAYDNLPGCCQYDHTMAMNQSGENSEGDDSENE